MGQKLADRRTGSRAGRQAKRRVFPPRPCVFLQTRKKDLISGAATNHHDGDVVLAGAHVPHVVVGHGRESSLLPQHEEEEEQVQEQELGQDEEEEEEEYQEPQ